jgi:hypothetical protein
MQASKLVVWDFDWSLVNENSDTFIIRQFDPDLADQMKSESLRSQFPVWTDLMVSRSENVCAYFFEYSRMNVLGD